MLRFVTVLYADDLVLMTFDMSEQEVMLQTFDHVCGILGMFVNPAQAELMAIGHDGELSDSVQLSGGEDHYVSSWRSRAWGGCWAGFF